MYEATLFKFGKWIDYGSSDPRRKNFPSKTAWSASCDVISFGMKACLFIARQHTIDIAILSICP